MARSRPPHRRADIAWWALALVVVAALATGCWWLLGQPSRPTAPGRTALDAAARRSAGFHGSFDVDTVVESSGSSLTGTGRFDRTTARMAVSYRIRNSTPASDTTDDTTAGTTDDVAFDVVIDLKAQEMYFGISLFDWLVGSEASTGASWVKVDLSDAQDPLRCIFGDTAAADPYSVLDLLTQATAIGPTSIDGRPVEQYRAELSSDDILQRFPCEREQLAAQPDLVNLGATVEAFVTPEGDLLRYETTAHQGTGVTRQYVDLAAHDDPVSIDLPDPADVVTPADLMNSLG